MCRWGVPFDFEPRQAWSCVDATLCDDGKLRCNWALGAPGFIPYHDTEWGFPVNDPQRLFEKLCLEAFQSGLSWRTILDKRDNLRQAFCNFDPAKVAEFGQADVRRLLQDAGIIRHRGKIEAVIHNAKQFEHVDLASLAWSFEPARRVVTDVPSTSPESIAFSKSLKAAGWKFVGPTTAYAFMQAMGVVNDHHPDCIIHDEVESARRVFTP